MLGTEPTEKTRVFAAFEGGGAKGIVHVGALKAMEERDFEFSGLAGTSAGAIVAALTAAGYKANDLLDTTSKSHILKLLPNIGSREQDARDLFGPAGWVRIKALTKYGPHLLSRRFVQVVTLLLAFDIALIVETYVLDATGFATYLLVSSFLFLIFAAYTSFWAISEIAKGLNKLDTFKSSMDILLTQKLFPNDSSRRVTMGDFGRNGRPALKVVASDIKNKKLKLFSSSSMADAHTPVAEVVAASICLPVIFEPWRLGEGVYLDGGMVSNLPIWPFDIERALDPSALTIAVEILPAQTPARKSGRESLSAIIETALFGASALNLRAVEELVVLKIPTRLTTLSFDANIDTLISEIEAAAQAARAQIARKIFEIPKLYLAACEAARDYVDATLCLTAWSHLTDQDIARVRVSIALPEDENLTSLRIKHCIGYEEDYDAGILLPIEGSVVGSAWRSGSPLLVTVPLHQEYSLSAPRSRRVKRLVAADLSWFFSIPINDPNKHLYGDSRPEFVVAIDGSGTFNHNYELDELRDFLVPGIREIFAPVVVAISELNDAERKAAAWT